MTDTKNKPNDGRDRERHDRDEERRKDGTKGNLDLDKDGAARREPSETDDATTTDQRGTGIPGFGV